MLSNHLNDSQKRLVLNSIVKFQFSYCPFVWIFYSRTSNNMRNKVHESIVIRNGKSLSVSYNYDERVVRVILNDYERYFETLLQNNNDVCSHHSNIQTLLIEIFKIKKGFAPPIMGSILSARGNLSP